MSDRTPALERREQQRNEALQIANRRRREIKVLKQAIKSRLVDDLALLRGDDGEHESLIQGWPIDRLLIACNRIGPARANEILYVARVTPKKKVKELSFRQRAHLAQLVEEARSIVIA